MPRRVTTTVFRQKGVLKASQGEFCEPKSAPVEPWHTFLRIYIGIVMMRVWVWRYEPDLSCGKLYESRPATQAVHPLTDKRHNVDAIMWPRDRLVTTRHGKQNENFSEMLTFYEFDPPRIYRHIRLILQSHNLPRVSEFLLQIFNESNAGVLVWLLWMTTTSLNKLLGDFCLNLALLTWLDLVAGSECGWRNI